MYEQINIKQFTTKRNWLKISFIIKRVPGFFELLNSDKNKT